MKRVASSHQDLTVEQRNPLSIALKNVPGARCASWRIVSSTEQKEDSKDNECRGAMNKGYLEKSESEIAQICEDILDKYPFPLATLDESKVFYPKMISDYHRYLREFSNGKTAPTSPSNYRAASDVAVTELPLTHPIHVDLALNFSVFYYEILNSLDDAIAQLVTLSEDSYMGSTLSMQLLRNYLTDGTYGMYRITTIEQSFGSLAAHPLSHWLQYGRVLEWSCTHR